MNYKIGIKWLLSCSCIFLLCACAKSEPSPTQEEATEEAAYVTYDEDDYYQDFSDGVTISLDEQSGDVEIKQAGTYILTGTLVDGSILINATKEDTVRLVLDNATISSSTFAAIYSAKAKKVIISLPAGTNNTISDASTYTTTVEDNVQAAIFSKDDLTINGSGTLTVTGNYKDAITSKDTLKLMEGTYVIHAAEDGVIGRDFLYVHAGNYTLDVKGDGFKTTYDTDDTKGDMIIESGIFQVTAEKDGFQAEHNVTIYDGTFDILTGGGSEASIRHANDGEQPGGFGLWNNQSTTTEDSVSAKGIKAGTTLILKGGSYKLDTNDDALHTNKDVIIEAGNYTIMTGDDGIHADLTLTIQGGTIDIQKSYEGLESATIDIYGGYIQIVASDDGINAAGGNDDAQQGMPQQKTTDFAYQMNIHGGTILVDASGDGLDSNGDITMDGGVVVVNGPTSGADGALDYDGTFNISQGTLIAVGMSAMAQTPSTTSTQNSLSINLSTTQSAKTPLYLSDADGNFLLGIMPTKQYNNVVISVAALTTDTNIQVYTGGSGGSVNDFGYIESGMSDGTLLEEVTISSSITTIGYGMGMGGMGTMGGERGQGKPGGQTPPTGNMR